MSNLKTTSMNKKIFSSLLMGAFFIASVSLFTSCKDYDDDITGLQSQVDGLKSELNQKVADLKAAQEKCAADCQAEQARLDAAIKALEAKAATKDELKAAIENVVNGYEAADAKLKAEAEEYARQAAATAAEAAKLQAIEEAKKYAEQLRDELDAKKVDVAEFAAKVQELEGKIAGIDSRLAKVEGAVEANTAAIEQMKTQIAALEAFKEQVEKDFPGVKADVEKALKGLEEQKAAMETMKKELNDAITAAKKELQDQIDELKKGETVAALTKRIETLEEQILGVDKNAKAIEEIKTAMSEADKKIAELGAALSKVNVLDLYLTKVLSSIYLKPEFFYGGIESIEFPALYDQAYTETGKDLTLEEVWAKDAKVAAIDVCKGGFAYYHLNPWNADIDGAKVAFLINEAKTRTGAEYEVNTLIKPVNETLANDMKDNKNLGVLPVEFTGSFEAVNALLKAGILPQAALRYQQTIDGKEVNVSSDWALIAPTQYSDLILADVTWNNHDAVLETPECGHLTQELVKLADPEIPATHEVLYSGNVNLYDLVRTHYSYSYRNAQGVEEKSADMLMDEATFEKFGLHYEFDLVDYTLGDNETSESVHAWIENGILTPSKVTEDGKCAKEQAGKAAVDRMPIVRVLIKTADNQVAAYGYMKFIIVEEETPDTPKEEAVVGPFTSEEKFYVDCDDANYEYTMTWSQVEARILQDEKALNDQYSKKFFEANWTLVGTGDVIANVQQGEATQFGPDFKELANKIGSVTLKKDEGNAETSVLSWVIDHQTIENFIAEGKVDPKTGLNTNDIVVYVKFEGKEKSQKDIWVNFTIPAGTFHFATGKIDDNKIASYWYDLNSPAAGKKEIRANVVVPGTQTDDCAFVFDMLNTFVGNTVVPANIDENFPKFKEQAVTSFEFTTPAVAKGNATFNANEKGEWTVKGNSGKDYTLALSEDKLSIVCGQDVIVKLTGDMNNVLEYQDNEVAKDILNYVGHDELGELKTFTAYIKVAVEACYDLFLLDNSEYFNVRFLRPVNLLPGNEYVMEDAVDGGSKINVMDLVKLTDWRDYKFEQHPDYIDYYEVEAITPDLEAVRTDIDLAEDKRVVTDKPETLKKLSEVTSNLLLGVDPEDATITWNEKAKKFEGQFITYANNSGNVQNFHLYIPLTITYKWGTKTQPIYSVITVKKTVENAKKF